MEANSASFRAVAEPVVARRGLKSAALLAAGAMLIFGAWTSLRYTFGAWAPDADVAAQVVLWDSLLHQGFGFLDTWRFTQDNWLFSLTSINFLIYSLFGTNPLIVVGVGWLIFVASVGMTSLLAYRVAGWRAAIPIMVVLIFANSLAIGPAGFLAHPVSHNVSAAWAVLALLLAHRAIARESVFFSVLVGLCILVDVLSDPWSGAAIALPLIIVSLAVAVLHWRRRAGWFAAILFVVAAISFWAARTRVFGLLEFMPQSGFDMTDPGGLVKNVGWMFRSLAIIFNIVPFADVDNVPANVIGFAALAAILISAVALTVKRLPETAPAEQLVSGVAIVSICGIAAAFMLFSWGEPTMIVGRFFPNVYYFGTLLVGIAAARNWDRLRWSVKLVFPAYGVLLIASGLASAPGLWTGRTPLRRDDYITGLATLLEQNNLSYGYGPYWGAQALAMKWMSDGRVTIRPVAFDKDADVVNGLHAQDSTIWYGPGTEPAGTRDTFLVVKNDGENCPNVDACVATAIRQFGEPSRRLEFEEAVILVWPYPIGAKIADH